MKNTPPKKPPLRQPARRAPLLFLALPLLAAAVWWFWPATPPEPTPLADAEPAAVEEVDFPAPLLPPEPEPERVVAAPEPPAPAFDPQLDLSTTIPDFIRLAQNGDMLGLMQAYMPPDQQARMSDQMAMIQGVLQTPEGQQQMQQQLQSEVARLQAIQFVTPQYDETGSRATYPANDGRPAIVFVQIDGRWYRER